MSSCESRAMSLWGKLIHSIFRHRCAMCGSTYMLEAHHIAGRRSLAVRYAIKLGILLCQYCHKEAPNAPHKHPTAFFKWLRRNYPERYELYVSLKNKIVRHYEIDMKEICRELEQLAKYAA